MKTMSFQPKVIIHRLGAAPVARRRVTPGAVVLVLLLLVAFAAGTMRSLQPEGPHSLRHLSSLR